MVLNYRAANYSGWPLSRFILYSHCILYTMQSYKKYLNYANISINIFSELLLKYYLGFCPKQPNYFFGFCHFSLNYLFG